MFHLFVPEIIECYFLKYQILNSSDIELYLKEISLKKKQI